MLAIKSNFIKFIIVGFASTIINFLIFYVCSDFLKFNPKISYSSGYLSGVLFGFVLNKFWSFGHKDKVTGLLILKYLLVYFISFLLGLLLFGLLLKTTILNEKNIEIIVIALNAAVNYLGLKLFIFFPNDYKKNKIFLKKDFFPKHEDNIMKNEGDLNSARIEFIKNRFSNVDFLLRKRYKWMEAEIGLSQNIIEVGSGSGFSKLYINKNIILTDAVKNPWIDNFLDATKMSFKDNSMDVIIASHTIHHFYNPAKFFKECQRVLKPGGKILISEIYTSFFMRLLLKLMKHEGYSYNCNVFSTETICNDPDNLWSANCAIPEMLFSNKKKFNYHFPSLTIEKIKYCEFSIFPLSGGVISKIPVPRFSFKALSFFSFIDQIFIYLSKSIFAMGMKVVIVKK